MCKAIHDAVSSQGSGNCYKSVAWMCRIICDSSLTVLPVFTACGPDEEDELYENSIVKTNMVFRLKDGALHPYKQYWGAIPKHEMLGKKEVHIFGWLCLYIHNILLQNFRHSLFKTGCKVRFFKRRNTDVVMGILNKHKRKSFYVYSRARNIPNKPCRLHSVVTISLRSMTMQKTGVLFSSLCVCVCMCVCVCVCEEGGALKWNTLC